MPSKHSIAYFCAEYGLDARLPIYAGGLGVLAGDTLKAAADLNLDLVAVGLLYRGKQAHQTINQEGKVVEYDRNFDPVAVGLEHVYLKGEPLFVKVFLKDHFIWLRVWQKKLGPTVTLYLLDTNSDQNQQQDRDINDSLYFGDLEKQLKQQILLGVGGVKLLAKLGLRPKLYHINEGRPAFMYWGLLRFLMQTQNLDFYQAQRKAKNLLVYTNHTLVPAGNYHVPLEMLQSYAHYYAQKMDISLDELLAAGLGNPGRGFSMTDFALKISCRQNGVSQLHSRLSQEIWPDYKWENITNGVHLDTWQDPRFKQARLGQTQLWQIHQENKQNLAKFVKERTGFGFDSKRLVIGWARRLAGYKRLEVLFADVNRLEKILKQTDKPVQLLVSGKAHQSDHAAKQRIYDLLKIFSHQLSGYALFIPDYDLDVARHLIRGTDVWLNTPERGKEACGTSGMKAISNGVLQLTTKDGWTDEVDWTGLGWELNSEDVSNHLYHLLETEVVPMFYDFNHQGFNPDWVQMMQKSIRLADQFSAKRMVSEYQKKLYQQL
jgi:starch phosphorylase